MRRIICLFLALLACAPVVAGFAEAAQPLQFSSVPHVLRPGKYYEIRILAPQEATASLALESTQGELVHAIYSDYPLSGGENTLIWDGTLTDHSPAATGDYVLRATLLSGESITSTLRVGAPYPMITDITQSAATVGDNVIETSFTLTDPGTLDVKVLRTADSTTAALASLPMLPGLNSFQWRGMVNGERVPPGDYALVMTLQAENGTASMPYYVYVEVQAEETEPPALPQQSEAVVISDATPAPTVEPESTPEPAPQPDLLSAPYSDYDDGSFWSMTPGETDNAALWDILMQPITVYDDGKIDAREHVYLMENPDGTGAKIAQIHGKSQGLHVIGEPNEFGYVLVEAFSNYDPEYQPKNDEERAAAFELKTGFLKASGLKTVEVKQDYALVIDKLTQRMYLYENGEPVTEFLIATGKIADNKYYNETITGEFITISHTGGFWSGNMYCDMAIRINGGILLHEVPHKVRADGSKDYSAFEGYLGTKQSHGCVRIQRLKTPEGYNHRWLWENFDRKGGYKVIVWDDANRVDTPTVWQPNPTN